MNKISLQAIYCGAFGLAVAVLFGAIGAHYLKEKLSLENLQIFETAVRYQFYGCIGLILMGILNHIGTLQLKWPIVLLRFGILIFCGTIYFLAIRPLLGINGMGWVGAITPFGGLAMIVGWGWVGVLFFKKSKV